MRKTRRTQAYLCVLQTITDIHQPVLVGNFEPVELELAMSAVLFGTHDWNAPHDAPARLVAVEQKRSESFARVAGRLRQQNEMLSTPRAGDEPLAPADQPFVTLPGRGRQHHRRVRARARRRFGN